MYGQVSTGQEQEFDYGIKNNSTQTVTTPTYLGTVGADGTYGKILLADLQGKKAFLSTGLIKNGLISANGDTTKFNITAGIGIISNFDDPENPTSTIINFPAFTGITPTYLLTGTITYVAINNAAAVVMQATPFTPEQRRSLIVLGAVVHSNLTTINVINNISAPSNASTNQLHDFIEAVGALNLTGNKYTANGANLQLNKSAGLIFKLGSNFANDWKNPHELAQTAGTSLTFRYRTQNGTEGSDRINLDPALYDLNNVLTAVPNNKFTIQTVTMFQSGVTRIQYGQNVYDDLATAKNAVFTRNFVLEPNSKENGIIRAYIIMKNTTTSLQNVADADILEAQKFGGIASGGIALTLANIVTALGFTPENIANKQNSLAVDGTGTKYATVDAINAALPTTYTKIVYVNTTSPTTATIFDLNNPPVTNDNALKINVNNLYIGTDASTWVYITSPAGYVTKVVPATSNFNIAGSSPDAGNNKTLNIARTGGVTIGATTNSLAKLNVTGSVSASSLLARGVHFNPNLVATANNDVLVGLELTPTFTNGAFTGVTNFFLRSMGVVSFAEVRATALAFSNAVNSALRTGITGGNTNINFTVNSSTVGQFVSDKLILQNGGTFTSDNVNTIQLPTGTISSGTTTLGNLQPTANNQLTRRDYITTNFAPLASPIFTGNPIAPTPTLGDNDTSVATTAFVQSTTNTNAVLLTGNQTVAGIKSINNTTQPVQNALSFSNSAGANSYSASFSNTGAGDAIYQINNSSGRAQYVLNESTGTAISVLNNNNSGVAFKAQAFNGATGNLYQGLNQAGTVVYSVLAGGEVTGLSFKPFVYIVATLPSPPITGTGTYATVSDALAPTYMATVVGGGSVVTPVFYNGTNWVAH